MYRHIGEKCGLGGLGVIGARDMEHAVELMSKHPGFGIDTHSQKNYRVIRMPVWCTESGRGDHCNKDRKNETTAIPYRSQPRYCSHLCSEEAVAANAAGKTVHLHGFAPFTILL